jgi:hypothetical protein
MPPAAARQLAVTLAPPLPLLLLPRPQRPLLLMLHPSLLLPPLLPLLLLLLVWLLQRLQLLLLLLLLLVPRGHRSASCW